MRQEGEEEKKGRVLYTYKHLHRHFKFQSSANKWKANHILSLLAYHNSKLILEE